MSAIMDQVKASNPNIGEGSLAAAKNGLDVQTIHAEAARIKLQDPSANTSAIMDQIKARYPNIGKGAFNLVLPNIVNKRKRSLQRKKAKTLKISSSLHSSA
jgi:hypothetical protein